MLVGIYTASFVVVLHLRSIWSLGCFLTLAWTWLLVAWRACLAEMGVLRVRYCMFGVGVLVTLCSLVMV